MPNHKFINSLASVAKETAIDLLDALYEPGASWWVCHGRYWEHINDLMAPPDVNRLAVTVADLVQDKYDIKALTSMHGGEPVGYLFGLAGQRLTVSIRSPQTLDAWGLAELSPLVIGQALIEYERAFGVRISGAPSTTGLRMMGAMTELNTSSVNGFPLVRPADMTPFEHNDAQDFIWTRELTAEETAMPYLHAFDKRRAYLYSADIDLGIGDCTHIEPLEEDYAPGRIEFDKRIPGLWRVEVFGTRAEYDEKAAPSGLPSPLINPKRGWYYTPMVALFRKLGLRFTVKEAYIFPQHQRVLHRWSGTLIEVIKRMGRSFDCDHPNDLAINAAVVKMAKRTFHTTIGLLGSLSRKDKTQWSYRPDWRGMIVSDAAARIYYGMLRARELCGRTPAAVYMDCLYYPSSEASPDSLPFSSDAQLSKGYHYEATYDLTQPGAQDLFRADGRKLNFAEKIQQFEIGGDE